MADSGTGTTITFGTSNFTAELLSVDVSDQERGFIDTTHMGTTGARTKSPLDLVDRGGLDIEFNFDPDIEPPIDQAAETITLTFPLPAGQVTAGTLAGTGFMTNWSAGIPLEDKMTATATIVWSAAPTWTDSAAV
jgi:hypothetical protein